MLMKILNLILKQTYFDAITRGQKVQEFREVKPSTIKKLLQLDEDGFEVVDDAGNAQPIKYDAIRFYVGYAPDRDNMLIEVKDAYCEIFVDENDKPIEYSVTNPKTGEEEYWVAEQVVYNLGKILELNVKAETKHVKR